MTSSVQSKPCWTAGRLATAAAVLTLLALVLTLGGPGITIDEPLDVRPGRTYVAVLLKQGWRFFSPRVVEAVFADNAEHPPLGRWLLGIASTLGEPLEVVMMGGADPVGLYPPAGRLAPALAFAALVGLVVRTAGARYGLGAGVASGFALAAMPRLFAHAHLGALDTFLCLFWTLAVLEAERALQHRRPLMAMVRAGLAWGLALLTKIHAWFLAPILLIWVLARGWSVRRAAALVVWGATGFALFVAGWPWLWYDPVRRLSAYWGTGVVRAPIHVLYFGRVFVDRDVPWHYPWFYFAVTVPVGLHALGVLGLYRGWRSRREDPLPLLLAGSILAFLVLFSTRVPVYDGERLFLVAFPLWALLAGLGFATAWQACGNRRALRLGLLALTAAQAFGVAATYPFGLSYYNALVGGLPGAERLGLELTYWNDAVDHVLLDRLVREAGPDDSAALVPTLYAGQGAVSTTRAMSRRPLILQDEQAADRSDWVVLSRRTAYWRPELASRIRNLQIVFTRSRQGVWLSALGRASPPQPRPAPPAPASLRASQGADDL